MQNYFAETKKSCIFAVDKSAYINKNIEWEYMINRDFLLKELMIRQENNMIKVVIDFLTNPDVLKE